MTHRGDESKQEQQYDNHTVRPSRDGIQIYGEEWVAGFRHFNWGMVDLWWARCGWYVDIESCFEYLLIGKYD